MFNADSLSGMKLPEGMNQENIQAAMKQMENMLDNNFVGL